MKLAIGIVGLPNVGKSTLFNALTKKSVPAENYPFCTIDPSVGIVAVPDERLTKLSVLSASVKTVPAVIEFVDIAGLVKGASNGEGMGNAFLSHIREVDAIGEVVRLFESGDITHVEGSVYPLRDVEIINTELALADLSTIEKRIDNLAKDIRKNIPEAIKEKEVLEKALVIVNNSLLLTSEAWTAEEFEILKRLSLLTIKPILYILNKKSGGKNIEETDERFTELAAYIAKTKASYVIIDAKVEDDLKDFEGEEKEMFRQEISGGVSDDGVNSLIKSAYNLLGLETYFTTGVDESRAWTIAKGSTAPVAGMAIHTDFRDKFIKADVVFYSDLLEAGSYGRARENGKLRTEGRDYIVIDGDVIEFKV